MRPGNNPAFNLKHRRGDGIEGFPQPTLLWHRLQKPGPVVGVAGDVPGHGARWQVTVVKRNLKKNALKKKKKA